jgi:hypothetical protein
MVRMVYVFLKKVGDHTVRASCVLDVQASPATLSLGCSIFMESDGKGALQEFMQQAVNLGLKTRTEPEPRKGVLRLSVIVDHSPAQLIDLFDKMQSTRGGFQVIAWQDPRQTLKEVIDAYKRCPHMAMLARSLSMDTDVEYDWTFTEAWMENVMSFLLDETDDNPMSGSWDVNFDGLLEDMLRGGTITYAWGLRPWYAPSTPSRRCQRVSQFTPPVRWRRS